MLYHDCVIVISHISNFLLFIVAVSSDKTEFFYTCIVITLYNLRAIFVNRNRIFDMLDFNNNVLLCYIYLYTR